MIGGKPSGRNQVYRLNKKHKHIAVKPIHSSFHAESKIVHY